MCSRLWMPMVPFHHSIHWHQGARDSTGECRGPTVVIGKCWSKHKIGWLWEKLVYSIGPIGSVGHKKPSGIVSSKNMDSNRACFSLSTQDMCELCVKSPTFRVFCSRNKFLEPCYLRRVVKLNVMSVPLRIQWDWGNNKHQQTMIMRYHEKEFLGTYHALCWHRHSPSNVFLLSFKGFELTAMAAGSPNTWLSVALSSRCHA